MPSDYPALRKATIEGGAVSSDTPLGKAFLAFAGAVANEAASPARRATLSDKLLRFARHGH
jgi:hypothetical protein